MVFFCSDKCGMLNILWGRGESKCAFNMVLKMVMDVYTRYSENTRQLMNRLLLYSSVGGNWAPNGSGKRWNTLGHEQIPQSCVWCEDTARNIGKTLSCTFYNPTTNQVLHQTCELWQGTAPNMYCRDASTITGDISRKLWTAPTVTTFGITHSSTSLRPLCLTAGGMTLVAVPICDDTGSTYFSSMHSTPYWVFAHHI
jgi:hypothetical protein